MHPVVVFLFRMFFPSVCVSCSEDIHPARSEPLCLRCVARLKPAPPLTSPYPLRGFRAAHLFEGSARDLVLRLKYGRRPYLARFIAAQVAEAATTLRESTDLIVPIPLPPTRWLIRGFNPSERLARSLAETWCVPSSASVLRRRIGFPSQTELGRRERLSNARKSFALTLMNGNVRGKNVLLIDDVSTTGATLAACADLLMRAGASSVSAAVFAWEPPGRGSERHSVSGGS